MNTNRTLRTKFVAALFAAAVIAAACSGESAQTTTENTPTTTADGQATTPTPAPTSTPDTGSGTVDATNDSSAPSTTDGAPDVTTAPTTTAAPASGTDPDEDSTDGGEPDEDPADDTDPDTSTDPDEDADTSPGTEPTSDDPPSGGGGETESDPAETDPEGTEPETGETDPDEDEPDTSEPAEDDTDEEGESADGGEYPTTATEAREAGDLLVATDQPRVILGGGGYGANAAAAGQCNNCRSDTPAGNQLTGVNGLVGSPDREPAEVWVPPATGTTHNLAIRVLADNLDDTGAGQCALGNDAVASMRPGDEIRLRPSSECHRLGLSDVSHVTEAAGVTHRVIATQRFVLPTQAAQCAAYRDCAHLPDQDFEYRVLVTCMVHPSGSGAASNHGLLYSLVTRHDPAGDVLASGSQALTRDQWTWHNGSRANSWVTCGEGLG